MTMQRRPLGRGRTLAAIGSLLVLVGSILPWWRLQPEGGLPALTGNAFEGAGILVFLSGVATLALLALPYAVGDRPVGIDRPLSVALLAVLGWIGLVWRIVQLIGLGAFRFDEPIQVLNNGPGLWLAGIGLVMLARAAFQMSVEPRYR
jgi:hypothetical protein